MNTKRVVSILALFVLVSLAAAVPANAATSISVVGAAALQGSFGMRVTYDAVGGAAYVQDNSPNAEANYFASFKIRTDGVTSMVQADSHQIFTAFVQDDAGGTPNRAFRVNLYKNAPSSPQLFAIHVFPMLDTNVFFSPRIAVNLLPGTNDILIQFNAGTGSANGVMKVYRGGVLRKDQLNLDNDTLRVGMVRLGAPATPDATSGFLDLDDFISTRTCPLAGC